MKKHILFSSFAAGLFLTGCATFSISKESFVSQLQQNQYVEREHNNSSVGIGYDSNGMDKIKCIDKNGKEVWLYADKNVSFRINRLSGGASTLYFDTVYVKNDTVYGLVSRIAGGKRRIALSDVDNIAINAEAPHTKPVD